MMGRVLVSCSVCRGTAERTKHNQLFRAMSTHQPTPERYTEACSIWNHTNVYFYGLSVYKGLNRFHGTSSAWSRERNTGGSRRWALPAEQRGALAHDRQLTTAHGTSTDTIPEGHAALVRSISTCTGCVRLLTEKAATASLLSNHQLARRGLTEGAARCCSGCIIHQSLSLPKFEGHNWVFSRCLNLFWSDQTASDAPHPDQKAKGRCLKKKNSPFH